jgi:uncharacterized protein (DUF2062 family)
MQPISSALTRRRLCHQQLCSRYQERPHEFDASPHTPQKTRQTQPPRPSDQFPSDTQRTLAVYPLSVTQTQIPPHHGWAYRRIALPILALLRRGASPEKLAWSLAAGALIGINPVIGSTTLLCLAVAFVFRLNVVASQITNHIAYPLQLILIIPFINLGSRLFHTAPMPLSAKELLHAARETPLALVRQLWLWESHALILWAVLSAVLIPILAFTLAPILRRLLARVQHHEYPIIPTR